MTTYGASDDVEAVRAPFVAVYQALVVQFAVAVKERDEAAARVAPRVDRHCAHGHQSARHDRFRQPARLDPPTEQRDAPVTPPAHRRAGNGQRVAEPVHDVADREPEQQV